MKKEVTVWLIVAFFILIALFLASTANVASKNGHAAVDYSKPEHWLALPSSVDKGVDVFYLYPTAYRNGSGTDPCVCEIDNPSMLAGAKSAFARQATAFETVANIYAPYYRQADAACRMSLPAAEQEKIVGGIPTSDAIAAFDYYIANFNDGRPFILAGHSQGSNVLANLLSGYMREHPEVYRRMIAAYVIGYSITGEYLADNPHLKFAEGPDDTGVIISYNTEASTLNGSNLVLLPGGIAINPVTWTRTERLATARESLGSFLPNNAGTFVWVPNYADARVDQAKGVVICSTADENAFAAIETRAGFPAGVYHSFDYPLYYYDIRENAANRIRHYFNSSSSGLASYPIDAQVFTTFDRTIIPVSVHSNAPKIAPDDIADFSQFGYGVWQYDAGLGYEKRLDLMPSNYSNASAANAAKLLNFFAMTDVHITDKESPAQAVYYGYKWGVISGYSPAMLYTTQTLDAAVQTVNALNKQNPFDFGIFLGDAINSGQYNELRWYIDVLDGRNVTPDSGARDDPVPGPHNDYQDEYTAAGLDKTIPWYQALGNHDHFWMGMFVPDDYINSTITGTAILNQGNVFTSPSLGINSRGFYMGAVNGSTPYGDIIGAGPVSNFSSPPSVPADPDRRFLSREEWIDQFFNTTSSPVGHGFNQSDAATGFACYSFEPNPDVPLKVIVLDDTQRDDDSNESFFGRSSLDLKRYNWLVSELDKGQAEGKLMIIAAHIPIGFKLGSSGLGSLMTWSSRAAVSDTDLIAKLHTYPNLILWIAGHRHVNTVTALKSPDAAHPELGFWEVETASLREFPQQFRTFQIVRNSDNTISIFATDVDPAVENGSLAANARSYAIAAKEIFNDTKDLMPSGAYNAELVKQLSPEMQAKIRNYGTSIGGQSS